MKIVLLSDTHGHMDERILRHAEGCDEVWHAGDIGNVQVTDRLSEVAHCRAVYGNIDGEAVRRIWPEHQTFELEGLTFWMTHIGGRPPNMPGASFLSSKAIRQMCSFVGTATSFL